MPDGLVVTSQPGPHPRALVELTWAGAREATVVRVDPDGSEVPVRNAAPASVLGMWVGHDHEMPLDAEVFYRAASPAVLTVTDTFTRTVANGWGTATSGHVWTVAQGAAAQFSVGSGVGTHAVEATNSRRGTTLATPALTDSDQTSAVTIPVTPTGAAITSSMYVRYTDADNHYYARLSISTAGAVSAAIIRRLAAADSAIGSGGVVAGLTHAGSVKYRVRVTAQGSALRMRVWVDGTPEPVVWHAEAADTNLTTGVVGCRSLLETGNTNTLPVAITYDDLAVTDLAAAPLVSAPLSVSSRGRAWLRHVALPTLTQPVRVRSVGKQQLVARRGRLAPPGRPDPIFVHQVRQSATRALVLHTDPTWASLEQLLALFADGSPLLLQLPADRGGDNLYISCGDVDVEPVEDLIGTAQVHRVSVPIDVIGRPPGASGGAVGATYADLDARYTDYAAQTASGRTYASLTAGP